MLVSRGKQRLLVLYTSICCILKPHNFCFDKFDSYKGGGEIRIWKVSIGNTKKYQLSYMTFYEIPNIKYQKYN